MNDNADEYYEKYIKYKNKYLELKSNIDNKYGSNGEKRKIDFDKNSSFIETKSMKISRKCINYNRDKIRQS
jgi:hypothetical protein